MNANELADELEAFHVDPDGFPYMISEAIAMLRQQQAEIEALKAKTLTDEEIYEIVANITGFQTPHASNMANWETINKFARAILRKAQEK